MDFVQFILSLINDVAARQEFAENPDKALDNAGFGHLSADDVHDALLLMQDGSQTADFSRSYDTGNEAHIATPEPVDGSESAAEYVSKYIYNNYITNEGDTITDNSINQQIDNRGGEFIQDIDVDSTVASGDGAVAAGDDIEDSTITTGDDNIVGDNNIDGDGNASISGDGNSAVIGNGNTTGFGGGDISSTDIDGEVSIDDGSSFAIGGSSSVDNSNYEDNDTSIDASDNSVHDSFNETSSWEDNSTSEDNDSHSSDDHSSVDSDVTIQA